MRAAVLLLMLLATGCLFGACADATPERPAANPEDSDLVDATPATITTRAPGEVLMLDVEHLLRASAEQGGDVYGIVRDDTTQPWRMIDGSAADGQAVEAWLSRFAPLDADGRYPDLTADSVMANVTHRIVFRFDDGSARTLSLEERADGIAAVSQADGPVFKLPAGRMNTLVPSPAELRAE